MTKTFPTSVVLISTVAVALKREATRDQIYPAVGRISLAGFEGTSVSLASVLGDRGMAAYFSGALMCAKEHPEKLPRAARQLYMGMPRPIFTMLLDEYSKSFQ